MKKRKTYEISIIDKTYSNTISDETKFYTSDTALELGFELKETEYNFESAEIVLLNIDDRSLVTRPASKVNNDFVYEIDDDITAHYGDWRIQLRFEQAGEIYVSSPVKFRIENDLGNDRSPQLSDVHSWVSLKRYADKLTDELKQAVLSVKGIEDTLDENELERQVTFEKNEIEREKAESQRQSEFDDNEASRTETFNTNEATRQENESTRQQAESQRQSTFEMNETERQSAELIRVENENQRNLTSVDEFVKLQNAVGGRNLITGTDTDKHFNHLSGYNGASITKTFNQTVSEWGATNATRVQTVRARQDFQVINAVNGTLKYAGRKAVYSVFVKNNSATEIKFGSNGLLNAPDFVVPANTQVRVVMKGPLRNSYDFIQLNIFGSANLDFYIWHPQLEIGDVVTDWSPAPEDYTIVSKDDYYNHIRLVNIAKDNEFNQLKQAVIALGGKI